MNNMQDLYESLSSNNKSKETYLEILAKLTKITREQMNALASDLAWQSWDTKAANS